jgi:hypothetical protein
MSFRGFGNLGFLRRYAMPALALLGGVIGSHGAEAATIYTYTFTQDYGVGHTLTGGFTGTADSFGDHISLGTLTDFHIEVAGPIATGSYSGLPNFFSFKIGDTFGTTLSIDSPMTLISDFVRVQVCTGILTMLSCGTDHSTGAIVLPGFGALTTSTVAPTVTLVSAVDTPPVATTPIPGALLLFSTALGGIGAAAALRRKIPA